MIAVALAQHNAVGERGSARGDVHGCAAGEIEATELVHPAGRVPGPAGDGVVDDGRPDEYEDYAGEHAAAVGGGTNGEGGTRGGFSKLSRKLGTEGHIRDGCEHALVDSK